MGVFFIEFLRSLKTPTKHLLGRTVIFLLYLVLGALVFQAIESDAENDEKLKYASVTERLVAKYSISQRDFNLLVDEIERAVDGGYLKADYDRWNFVGSFLFSSTVVTTIGYGHMAPITTWGRTFCMIYALFGIPIAGLMLKSIGEKVAEVIPALIRNMEKKLCKKSDSSHVDLKTTITVFVIMILMLLILAGFAHAYEGWTFFEGFYFAFITLFTIGFGDFVPMHPSETSDANDLHTVLFTIITFVYITVGLAMASSALLAISRLFEYKENIGFTKLATSPSDDDLILNHDGKKEHENTDKP